MASISRFGRAISSGNSVSDSNFGQQGLGILGGLVQALGKVGAVAVVIKNSSRSIWPDNRLWDRLRQFQRRRRRALKALENARNIMELSSMPGPVLHWRPGLNQKHQILRIARTLLLILLVVLLLPYLLAPLYRAGHPVSALMAWRRLTGAPVSRQWIDFNAISP